MRAVLRFQRYRQLQRKSRRTLHVRKVLAFFRRLNRRIFAEVGCHRSSKPSFRMLRSAKFQSAIRMCETHFAEHRLTLRPEFYGLRRQRTPGNQGCKVTEVMERRGSNCLWMKGLERIYGT